MSSLQMESAIRKVEFTVRKIEFAIGRTVNGDSSSFKKM